MFSRVLNKTDENLMLFHLINKGKIPATFPFSHLTNNKKGLNFTFIFRLFPIISISQ